MTRTALGLALAIGLASVPVTLVAGEQTDGSTRLSMDIAVTRYLVDANGKRMGPDAEAIRYRLARQKTSRGWRTTMTMGVPSAAPLAGGPVNRFLGGRVDVDEAGRFTMFDKDGHEVDVPAAMRPVVAPEITGEWSQWVQSAAERRAQRDERLAEIEAMYGKPSASVGGLSRFVRRTGDDVEELLWDAANALPVELNVARGGALKGRITFDYAEQPGRGLVRRGIRSETIVNEQGHRAITLTEFSNVVSGQER